MPAVSTQMKRNNVAKDVWANIFNTEKLNETQSTLFVKKMIAVCISSVTYLRAIFPEDCFGDRCIEDLGVKILRNETKCPGSCQVINWVTGCFDAIEKKYLRKMILGFYLDARDPDTVLETYTFKVDYFNQGVNIYRNDKIIAKAPKSKETKLATVQLMRTLVAIIKCTKQLPDEVMMTMKILYYDDVTPGDYQPPGFQETDYVGPDDFSLKLNLGDAHSYYHMFGVRVQSKLFHTREEEKRESKDNESYLDHDEERLEMNDEDDMCIEDFIDLGKAPLPACPLLTNDSKDDVNQANEIKTAAGCNQDIAFPMGCASPSRNSFIPDRSAANGVNTGMSSPKTPQCLTQDEVIIKCSCGFDADDGMMILCDHCKRWQHASCYCIFSEQDCPQQHFCIACAVAEKKECTDRSLAGLDPIALQTTCLWRRALVSCRNTSRLTAPKLAERLGVELTVAQGLMKRMQNEKFIRHAAKGKRLGKLITKEKFSIEALKSYFNPVVVDENTTKHRETNETEETSRDKELEKYEKNKLSDDQEFDRMLDKAMKINISGQQYDEKEVMVLNVPEKTKDFRGRKRLLSSSDLEVEFAISNSQDSMDHGPSTKKVKASAAEQAVAVYI